MTTTESNHRATSTSTLRIGVARPGPFDGVLLPIVIVVLALVAGTLTWRTIICPWTARRQDRLGRPPAPCQLAAA
jgi:hypothetical protein